ncbi:hypothetical protein H2204_008450 [Knufia peltigerae]|uniref:Aminoglycoside phosphotransferase domain-containing protein n=1 Tax=Knufia peltigerae TaxID=1002370 RepID=A0AA38Y184_9EURO|nr:hypothetical protein H2204_008450 [Knufia peltigerae]
MSFPILSDTNLEYDEESWDSNTQTYETWKSKLLKRDNLSRIGKLIDKHRGGGVPDALSAPQKGAFNAWTRLTFADGGSAVMRIPIPGKAMFPEEKTEREVAVVRFLTDETNVPVPFVGHGRGAAFPADFPPQACLEKKPDPSWNDNANSLQDQGRTSQKARGQTTTRERRGEHDGTCWETIAGEQEEEKGQEVK